MGKYIYIHQLFCLFGNQITSTTWYVSKHLFFLYVCKVTCQDCKEQKVLCMFLLSELVYLHGSSLQRSHVRMLCSGSKDASLAQIFWSSFWEFPLNSGCHQAQTFQPSAPVRLRRNGIFRATPFLQGWPRFHLQIVSMCIKLIEPGVCLKAMCPSCHQHEK